MTEKRGSFFRHEKDSIGNFRRGTKVPCHFSPLTLKTAPGAARTRNLQLRRLTLYPVELRALRDGIIICRSADHNRLKKAVRLLFPFVLSPASVQALVPTVAPLRPLPHFSQSAHLRSDG